MSQDSRKRKKRRKLMLKVHQAHRRQLVSGNATSTPGYPALNKKTISKGKWKAYERSILSTHSYQTLVAGSTFNAAGYKSYYNSQVQEWSKKLYAPTATECVALRSSSLSTFSNSMTRDFWFTSKRIQQTSTTNCPVISLPSIPSSSVECKDGEPQKIAENDENPQATPLITNKMRMYFNSSQRAMLRQWIGCCRKVYNMVTADYRHTGVLKKLPFYRRLLDQKMASEWLYLQEAPYNARDEAMRQAIANIKSAITNLQRGNIERFSAPFRRKKEDSQVLPVRAQNISKDLKVYPRLLFNNNLVVKSNGQPKYMQKHRKKTNYDHTRTVCDSNLMYKRRTKRWYLCLVSRRDGFTDRENQATENECLSQPLNVVSLDPGNRTFATWYSPTHGIGKLGEGDGQKLVKICLHLDHLYSKRTKLNHHKKRNLDRAIAKLRSRLENLREDFHRKVSSWLTSTFDVIVLPIFNTHLMAKRGQRKIGTKTVRGLMTWAHGKFRQTLTAMCIRAGKTLIHPSEAYTSKTCSTCGWTDNKLGGNEVFRCSSEHKNVDRDVNGARGIFLRALLGGALSLRM